MSFRLDFKKKVTANSNRAKSVDIHPTETWYIVSLYNGTVNIWNYSNESLMKTFNVSVMPVRAVRFVPRKCWFVTGCDDLQIQIYNYNTMEKVHSFEAHSDYIRALAVNPSLPFVLSAGDDMTIKLWDWEKNWQCIRVFEGHQHYIMGICFNPKDHNIFASASLDKFIKFVSAGTKYGLSEYAEAYLTSKIKSLYSNNLFSTIWKYCPTFFIHSQLNVLHLLTLGSGSRKHYACAEGAISDTPVVWQIGHNQANLTIVGHSHGSNCVDYCFSGDKPYLVSGGDDGLIKIWDYQTKACIQTLCGHGDNVMSAKFHPELPLIFTGSEDGTVRIWNSITYKLENVLNYSLGRVWDLSIHKGVNGLAIAFDEGSVFVQLGEDLPKISMDSNGKLLLCRNSEILQANTKLMQSSDIKDGEVIAPVTKELGTCEIFPNRLLHSPNGKYVAVIGSFEFTVYTALALRSKVFGKSESFCWSTDSSSFATIENETLNIYRNFRLEKQIKLKYYPGELYGGYLLGIGTKAEVYFYNWSNLDLIHRVEISPHSVYWNSGGNLCALASEHSFYILKYNMEKVDHIIQQLYSVNGDVGDESVSISDGIEGAFDLVEEYENSISSGIWIGDCFLFVNKLNKLCYAIGSEVVVVAHMEKPYFILNYVPTEDRIYLGDKSFDIISYKLNISVLHFQTLILSGNVQDSELVYKLLSEIPSEHSSRIAQFLQTRGFYREALSIATDNYQQFSLALKLNEFDQSLQLARILEDGEIWKKLAAYSIKSGRLDIARESLWNAEDYATLIFMSYCIKDAGTIRKIASKSMEKRLFNIAFLANHILGNIEECSKILIQSHKYPEAALFAHTYDPRIFEPYFDHWKNQVAILNDKYAASLASPSAHPNMFEKFQKALEQCLASESQPKDDTVDRMESLDINKDFSTDEMLSADDGVSNDGSVSQNPLCDA